VAGISTGLGTKSDGEFRGIAPESITSPSDAQGSITIVAVDENYEVALFSSRGSQQSSGFLIGKLDLVASGVSIVAPCSRLRSYPGYPNSHYSSMHQHG